MTAIDSDVLKVFTSAYGSDGCPLGTDFSADLDVGEPIFAKLPDSNDLFDGHTAPMTSFLRHIQHVVGMRPEEQMARVDAYAIVAPMQNPLSFRNRTARYLPGNSMGRIGFVLNTEGAVSVPFEHRSSPLPAILCLPDFSKKPAPDRAMLGAVIFRDFVEFSAAANASEFNECGSMAHKFMGILT